MIGPIVTVMLGTPPDPRCDIGSATDGQPPPEVLAGLVTFHNAESGFCVLRVKARGHRDLVTVVGHAATISAGEWVNAGGTWVNDRTHGLQFRARFLRTSAPTSVESIERYLASGMIRGIGPTYAKKLVTRGRRLVVLVGQRKAVGIAVRGITADCVQN